MIPTSCPRIKLDFLTTPRVDPSPAPVTVERIDVDALDSNSKIVRTVSRADEDTNVASGTYAICHKVRAVFPLPNKSSDIECSASAPGFDNSSGSTDYQPYYWPRPSELQACRRRRYYMCSVFDYVIHSSEHAHVYAARYLAVERHYFSSNKRARKV